MSSRSLNKVQLIGNLTRDPELKYTQSGSAFCRFGLATNRNWRTATGEEKEETEFHSIVAWDKLAELCATLLVEGNKIYVEGRLHTKSWTNGNGETHVKSEIVIDEIILLHNRKMEIKTAADQGGTS